MTKAHKWPKYVVAVAPEFAAGPGWANRPLWVYLWDSENNKLERECVQPEQQTPEILSLYTICAAAHEAMCKAVTQTKIGKAQKWAPKGG